MEQSPSWKANRFSASQKIPRILWNPEVHYRIHKCPPPVPILSHLDSVHTRTYHFLKIHLTLVFPFKPWSPKWSFTVRFPHQNPVYASTLPHTCYMPLWSRSSRFYHPNNNGEEHSSLSSSLCSFLHSLVTSSPLGPNILNTLFSNIITLRSSLYVSDQVSHPYKTAGKIRVMYFLIFKLLDSRLEDKTFCTERQQAFPDFSLLLISSWIEFWFVKGFPKY